MNNDQTITLHRTKRQIEAVDTDIYGSTFTDVKLSGAAFSNVNLSDAIVNDANMSGWSIHHANLHGLRISQADLTNSSIVESLTSGMTIDGILVSDLMAAYRRANSGD